MCWSERGGPQGARSSSDWTSCSEGQRYQEAMAGTRLRMNLSTDSENNDTFSMGKPTSTSVIATHGSSSTNSDSNTTSQTSTTTTSTTTTTTSTRHAETVARLSGSAGHRTSCCWLWKGLMIPRGILMWPLSLQVLLLTICYSRHVSSDDQLNLIHSRLVNMLKTKQSLFYRRHLRADPGLDLREHRVFHSDPKLDCCPTLTEFEPRRTGINPSGLVLELFSSKNFTQSFYETICHPSLRKRPCQFIDPRISSATRCVQQFSYVYAIGRTYGSNEIFRVDYIRIPAGCKCQVRKNLLRRRKKSVRQ